VLNRQIRNFSMFALFAAKRAAVRPARGCRPVNGRIVAALMAVTCLSACGPVTPQLAGNDPADPTAKVAAVGYRSTIAPYTSLRPATPAPWGGRNDGDAPPPKADR
jgi:hypothetical protein